MIRLRDMAVCARKVDGVMVILNVSTDDILVAVFGHKALTVYSIWALGIFLMEI